MGVVGAGLLLTGTILWVAERFGKNDKGVEEMSIVHAIVVGVMQGLAITPGVSRSDMPAFHRKVLWAKKPPSPFDFLSKMDIA